MNVEVNIDFSILQLFHFTLNSTTITSRPIFKAVCHRAIGVAPAGTETYSSEVETLIHFHCIIIHMTKHTLINLQLLVYSAIQKGNIGITA